MTICIFVHLGAPTHRALLGFVCSVHRHPLPALEETRFARLRSGITRLLDDDDRQVVQLF
jgi:hypothetical protein